MYTPLEVIGLSKAYNKKEAVKNISFKINKNEIIGILGPNGCGKTTTIGMILGLLKPSKGKVLINGFEIESKRVEILNNLNFNKVDQSRYPMIKILNFLSDQHSLYDTVIVSTNDVLVDLFLNKKIKFTHIQKKLFSILKKREFLNYKKILPTNIKQILDLNKYVRLKVLEKVYKS